MVKSDNCDFFSRITFFQKLKAFFHPGGEKTETHRARLNERQTVLCVCVCPKKGPHGLDGAVEKYFQKGENAVSRFSWGKVVDVYRKEEGGGAGAKRSMFAEVEGTTAALTARLILLQKKGRGLERKKMRTREKKWWGSHVVRLMNHIVHYGTLQLCALISAIFNTPLAQGPFVLTVFFSIRMTTWHKWANYKVEFVTAKGNIGRKMSPSEPETGSSSSCLKCALTRGSWKEALI